MYKTATKIPPKSNWLNMCKALWFFSYIFNSSLFLCRKYFIYLFLERGEGREKERERNINVWLPLVHPPTGDLACNPGLCPAWELNQGPFGSWAAGTLSTEPHKPGLFPFKKAFWFWPIKFTLGSMNGLKPTRGRILESGLQKIWMATLN